VPAVPAVPGADATDTHCPYCALQCAMTLGAPDEAAVQVGAPLAVTGRAFPTNRGGLCQKGWTSAQVLRAPDRLTTPLVRGADGRLHPGSWDAALDLVAERLAALQAEHGRDAVAVFGGGGLTNEKAYALGKFARVALRTRYIDYNGRFCMASAAAGANRAFGIDRGLPFPLADLAEARAVVLLGSNVADTMPPSTQHLAGVRAQGGLVVVDPRHSATAVLTDDGGGIHLQPVPGTDLAVLLTLLHVVLVEGLADEEYLAARTTGIEEVRRSVASWWPERGEQVTGVPADDLRRTARMLAARAGLARREGGGGVYLLSGRGVEQSSQGTATVTAAINLALALGLPGRLGGYGAVTGQGNGQGGREHGQKADQLPGYRRIDDPAARAHVAAVWGVAPDDLPGPGVPAIELLRRCGTPEGPRALLVHGCNLVVSAPDADRVRERLRALDLLVVCDLVPSETTELAHVVLPVTQWAEEEGTMTSLEGRVLRRRRAITPPPGVRSELEVLHDLAARLGVTTGFPTEPSTVFDELARASAGGVADYGGLSHARLDAAEARGEALHWPVPAAGADGAGHPGTPRLFLESFPTPDGRARLFPVEHRGPSEDLRADAPLFLVTGRVLQHYQSGAQTRRVPALAAAQPEPFAELHPALADRLGVADGELVELRTARGTGVVVARVTPATRPDTVFLPFHWSGPGSANRLTTDAVDPISGMPEFKVCAVDVRAAGAAVPQHATAGSTR
jgi:assimilatory nitrate reductase catalytic subunit